MSDAQLNPEKLFLSPGEVLPQWIDLNGHMNVAYYLLAFDQADEHGLQRYLGYSPQFLADTQMSTMSAEARVRYRREILEGEAFCIFSQLLDFDEKRWHEVQYMVRGSAEDWAGLSDPSDIPASELVATHEWLALSVDLSVRRVRPFHAETLAGLQRIWELHQHFAIPEFVGGFMGVTPAKSLAKRQA